MDGTNATPQNEAEIQQATTQRLEAERLEGMIARMDGDIQMAVRRDPNSAVAQAVLNSNGTTEGVIGKLIEMRVVTGLPPELQRMVSEQVAALDAKREAENKAAYGLAAGIMTAASNVSANNAYAESLHQQGERKSETQINYNNADYSKMSAAEMAMISASQYEGLSDEDRKNFHGEAIRKAIAIRDEKLDKMNMTLDRAEAAGISGDDLKRISAVAYGLPTGAQGARDPRDTLIIDGKLSDEGMQRALKRIEGLPPGHQSFAKELLQDTIETQLADYGVATAVMAKKDHENGDNKQAFKRSKSALEAATDAKDGIVTTEGGVRRQRIDLTIEERMEAANADGRITRQELRDITGYSAWQDYREYHAQPGAEAARQAELSRTADMAGTVAAQSAQNPEEQQDLAKARARNFETRDRATTKIVATTINATAIANDSLDEPTPVAAAPRKETTIDIGDSNGTKLAGPLAQFVAPAEAEIGQNSQISEPTVAVAARKPVAPQASAGMG